MLHIHRSDYLFNHQSSSSIPPVSLISRHKHLCMCGDPDTLTNFGTNSESPQSIGNGINGFKHGKGFVPYNRKTDIRPIVEYGNDRDEDRLQNGTEEPPCEEEFKPDKKQSAFNRNLYNLWRTYGVASALLKASNEQATSDSNQKKNKKTKDDNGDRIQLIHPPTADDKKLKPTKGKSNERKYHYHYDHDHDHYHHYDHFDDGKNYGKQSYRRNTD
ncbi:uncharacterized protein LOC134227700 [Armigeres subalbatus]|uniref:uncharacterized protein LOC134227700 n=1 Tax=Armigeres subalbatus TaxID=124917 RepID=UPI002ED5A917